MSAFHTTFVSHAHADNDLCDRYVAALRARGIDIWYDRDNAQNGHLLGSAIQDELKRRSAFVLLMTEASLTSFWVDLETQTWLGLMAQQRSRLLLPVRIGSCAVPPMLNAFFWVDAQAMPFEKAIDAIAAALNGTPSPSASHRYPTPRDTLPPLGPAPAPANSAPAHHLTPMPLYNLGFRGYTIGGIECILPPLCPVPGGVFTMGSDKSRDKEAQDRETPQYPVEVDSFAIGQHPVTVAEYACAVRAKVVREPPQYESGGNKYGPDWVTQHTHPDHPVVCVSWDDAIAYLKWLAKTDGPAVATADRGGVGEGGAWRWTGASIPGAIRSTRRAATRAKAASARPRPSVVIPTARVPITRRIWPATSGSGRAACFSPIPTAKTTDGRIQILLVIECCVAVRGATIPGLRARPTASTSTVRPTSTSTEGSVWLWRVRRLVQHNSLVLISELHLQ